MSIDRSRTARAVLACFAVIGLAPTGAAAHGVVGARSFIEPFIAEDVNPKNELVVARPEIDRSDGANTFHYGFGLEKKLADDLSLTLDSEWLHIDPQGGGVAEGAEEAPSEMTSGFGNLGIVLKYAFLRSPEHEGIASFAVEATAPTGSEDVGSEQDWAFRPFFLYGKGFGDLAGIDWLRPLAVQGDFGPEISTAKDTPIAFEHDIAVQYSLPYLQGQVKDLGLGWPFANLIADVEFNFAHAIQGEHSGVFAAVLTSGIVYMDGSVEVGVAARFPLNADAREEIDPGVVFIVDLFIDDLLPWTRWQPIGGTR